MKITSLTVTAEDGTVHVAEGVGSGRFTTAEDAAEHPATTVTEQV